MEARALHDFRPTNSDELGFSKGDTLYIQDTTSDENWWTAVSKNNPEQGSGFVPRTYIKMEPNDWYIGKKTRAETEAILLKGDLPDGVFVIRDSESSPGGFSMSIRFGNAVQHFKVLKDSSNQYFLWVVKFPSINRLIEFHRSSSVSRTETIFLKDMPKEGAEQQKPDARKPNLNLNLEKVICMYEFKTDDSEEVPFQKGDELEVLEKDIMDSWWKGRNTRTGKVGLFPINYVKQMK